MTVLAHNSGIDEILLVAVPAAVAVGVLWWVERRRVKERDRREKSDVD